MTPEERTLAPSALTCHRAGDEDVSTRVEGAEPPVILLTAKATLAAGTACLMLTVTQESGDLWRYNLSERNNSRLAYGKIIVPGHVAALRRAAQICAGRIPARHHRRRPARRIRPRRAMTCAPTLALHIAPGSYASRAPAPAAAAAHGVPLHRSPPQRRGGRRRTGNVAPVPRGTAATGTCWPAWASWAMRDPDAARATAAGLRDVRRDLAISVGLSPAYSPMAL